MSAKELSKDEIDVLLTYKESKVFTTKTINYLFGNRTKFDDKGGIKILPPLYKATDTFTLPANTLANQKESVKTTVGRYFFNVYAIVESFQDKIDYVNRLLKSGDIAKLQSEVITLIQKEELPPSSMGKFLELTVRLAGFNEIFTPSISPSFIAKNPKIEKRKEELLKEYKTEVENGDAPTYINKIEKVLVKEAKEELSKDEAFCYYDYGGGASMENHYNNMNIGIGVVDDPANPGKYKIIKDSLSDGINLEEYPEHVNTLISASFNRANNTAISGYKTKLLFAATQHVKAGKKGSDCGSTKYQKIFISDGNKNDNLYMWVKQGKGLIQLTPDNIDSFVGQTLEFRFPTYCKAKNSEICNKCLGDQMYMLGYKNIGSLSVIPSNALMYTRMKAMHNTKKAAVKIDLAKFVESK